MVISQALIDAAKARGVMSEPFDKQCQKLVQHDPHYWINCTDKFNEQPTYYCEGVK